MVIEVTVVEPLLAIILGFIAGGLGGFMNSVLKWLEIDEPFNSKKNIKAIIVGVVAGLAITIAAVSTLRDSLRPDILVVQLFIIFIGAAGAQSFTTKISGIVASSGTKKPVTTDNNPKE